MECIPHKILGTVPRRCLVESVIDSCMFVVRTCNHVVHDHESVSDLCLAVFGHREAHGTHVVLLFVACELIWKDLYSTLTVYVARCPRNLDQACFSLLVVFQVYVDNCEMYRWKFRLLFFCSPDLPTFAQQHNGRVRPRYVRRNIGVVELSTRRRLGRTYSRT